MSSLNDSRFSPSNSNFQKLFCLKTSKIRSPEIKRPKFKLPITSNFPIFNHENIQTNKNWYKPTSAWYSCRSPEVSGASFSATVASHRTTAPLSLLSIFHFKPDLERLFLSPFCPKNAFLFRLKPLFVFFNENDDE